MKVRANIKSGIISTNHNEKLETGINSIESKKTLKKLQLTKETVKELKSTELKNIVGGKPRESFLLPSVCI